MANKGIAPPDPDTRVGRLRILVRDVEYVELNPPEEGYGDYAIFSDAELEAYLIQADDSVLRAASLAIAGLALQYSAEGKSIRTDDLQVDLKSRGADLLAVARAFREDADADDQAAANDFFELVPYPMGRAGHCACRGELGTYCVSPDCPRP